MPDRRLARHRQLYAYLLRLYPRPYRERFGEGMEQTFQDLCRERMGSGAGLFTFALWAYADACIGLIREHISFFFSTMYAKPLFRVALLTALLLLIPLWGNRFVEGWNWTLFDFIFAAVLIFGTGSVYVLITAKTSHMAYRIAVGMMLLGMFLLAWINLAVGIIGNEDNPDNLMYFGVIALGMTGAFASNLEARGMARTLFAMALATALIPLIALTGQPQVMAEPPGVARLLILNGFFVLMWIGSGLLFRQTARTPA